IKIEIMDAHNLPFSEETFDLVLLFEAIYYLKEPQKFIQEAKRVLREEGILIICTVNKEWEDFHPSPYSVKYFSVPELYEALRNEFKEVKLFGAFKVEKHGIKNRVVSFIKKMAVKLNLIPGSLKARAYLKRIFMGKQRPLPYEIKEGMANYTEPVSIPVDKPNKEFKIIYAVAKK
ncbi:class I SAM-dependent methyltransferase, partial [Thermodesulfovibrio sp.]